MLQSPKFLFHVEGAGRRAGDQRIDGDYEIASRLSYFLWDTMPDRRLFEAAANGELRQPGRHRARRPRHARAAAGADKRSTNSSRSGSDSIACWARSRIAADYPEFTPELAAMMVQETRMLLDNLVWNDGNFMEAFTADYSFLNSDLASLYGVPAPAGEFELVRFPADCAPRRPARPRIVPGVERRTGRDVADRARHLHPRAAALPARAEPAARREHAGAGADGRASAGAAPAHAGARRESDVRELSPAHGSDRLRTGKLRRGRQVARAGSHRIRSAGSAGTADDQDGVDCRLTARARLPASRTPRSPSRVESAACSPTAARARNASSNRCFATRLAGWRRPPIARPLTSVSAAFRESGFKFKELLIALVRAPRVPGGSAQ